MNVDSSKPLLVDSILYDNPLSHSVEIDVESWALEHPAEYARVFVENQSPELLEFLRTEAYERISWDCDFDVIDKETFVFKSLGADAGGNLHYFYRVENEDYPDDSFDAIMTCEPDDLRWPEFAAHVHDGVVFGVRSGQLPS